MDPTPTPDVAAEADRLAALVAVAGPVAHEFNNYLNAVVLQIAVLQQQAAEPELREDLAALRRQGKRMAELVHRWQNYRQRSVVGPQAVDLNAVVRDEVGALCRRSRSRVGETPLELEEADAAAAEAVVVRFQLAADLPKVTGTPGEVRVLTRFLVANAAAAIAARPARVTVRTARDADGVTLAVADNGPPVAAERLAQVFDPFEEVRDGTNPLELFAAESLVRRRLGGRLEARAAADGGLELAAHLRPYSA